MSNQEAFDRVTNHLLTQMKQSKSKSGNCLYRGTDGTSCAVGCLIADEHYYPSLEGLYANSSAVIAALKKSGVKCSAEMLLDFQDLHDCSLYEYPHENLSAIIAQLKKIAEKHGVKFNWVPKKNVYPKLKVGDKVTVFRGLKPGEYYWKNFNNSWAFSMTEYVGNRQIYTVKDISRAGVTFAETDIGWRFPPSCLKKISNKDIIFKFYSDLLNLAADKYLKSSASYHTEKSLYSCSAIYIASGHIVNVTGVPTETLLKKLNGILVDFGLDGTLNPSQTFMRIKDERGSTAAQCARYDWLKLMAAYFESESKL